MEQNTTKKTLAYGVGTVAEMLGVSKSLLYREIAKGTCELPHYRIGNRIVFPAKKLERFFGE